MLEEAQSVAERCAGYRKELIAAVSDVIEYERQNRVQGTNIQQKIGDKCNAIGRFLAEQRGATTRDGDGRG